MGIDNFHSWLKQRFSNVFVPTSSKNVYDYIYLDINHILHNSMYKSSTEEEFFNKLTHNLNIQFCNFLPTKKVIFAIDGPAPYSKVVLQRKRRLQSVENVDMDKLNYLHITPGTPLMKKLDIFLEEYGKFLVENLSNSVDFVVLPTTQPDEGELKILKHIILNSENDPHRSHLIIGNDADLIVLAMSLDKIYDIHLLVRIKNHYELVSIPKLINSVCKEVNISKKDVKNIEYVNNNNIKTDFATVMLMAGNDYLPKLKYTKLDTLWKSYVQTFKITKRNLITDGVFDIKFLDSMMSLLLSNMSKQFKYSDLECDDCVKSYLEGLLWCLNMYQTGKCPKYDYFHRYGGVSPSDILYYISRNKEIVIPRSDTKPLNSDIYTLLIMPQHGKKLIPKDLQIILKNDLKHIFGYEKCQKCIDLKNSLNSCQKVLRQLSNNKEDTNAVKEKLKHCKIKLEKHKKTHKTEFTIDDVKEIISCTENKS